MEKEILKALVGFFSTLEKIEGKWREKCDGVVGALEGLKNFSEQMSHVNSKEIDNAEICGIENVREKLRFKIDLRMEEEFLRIVETVRHLGELNQELKNKFIQLERVRSKMIIDDPKMKEIVEGTPHRPRLDLLLEWAIDAQEYYQQLYNEINEKFKALEKTKRETIIELIEIITKKENGAVIDRILGFTQYLTRETIR